MNHYFGGLGVGGVVGYPCCRGGGDDMGWDETNLEHMPGRLFARFHFEVRDLNMTIII